ncbi:MAG: hypothetical protein Q9200_002046 [Gallowayella weberi]
MTEFDLNTSQIDLRRRTDGDFCKLESPGPGTPTGTHASISPTPPSTASPDLTSSTDQAGISSKAQPNTSPTVASASASASTIDFPVAAASVIGNAADEARLCVQECQALFGQCRPGNPGNRKRRVDPIDCRAAGNCFCTETPWQAGSTSAIDREKVDQICSDTCTAVDKGNQYRLGGALKYTYDDLWGCLAQAQGSEKPGTGEPAGCMGA